MEEANGPGHWLVNPLIILLSQVAHLPQERLLPVHQVLQETNWTFDTRTSDIHFLVIASYSLAPSRLMWCVWSHTHSSFGGGKPRSNHTVPFSSLYTRQKNGRNLLVHHVYTLSCSGQPAEPHIRRGWARSHESLKLCPNLNTHGAHVSIMIVKTLHGLNHSLNIPNRTGAIITVIYGVI